MFDASDSSVEVNQIHSLHARKIKLPDIRVTMIPHTHTNINLHGIYENATIKSFSHVSGFCNTTTNFSSYRGRKISEEVRKAKHREVQRRFIQRKKEALDQTKKMARMLEAKVSFLKVSQESTILEAENHQLQLAIENPLRCIDHLSDAFRRMEEEIKLIVHHYVPLQHQQIRYAQMQAAAEMCQILSDPNYQTVGAATMGWTDRRKIETSNQSAVKFVFGKTFFNVSPSDLYQRTWKNVCDTAILRDYFSPELMLRKHMLQQIDDDTFVTYRVIYNRQNRELSRAVELSYRSKKGDDYYLFTQSVNEPYLTKCLDTGRPCSQMLTWIKFSPISELNSDACRFQYGGSLSNITPDGARYWMMEFLFVMLRYESLMIRPRFTLC
uniref:Uncharacterized protein AlNc14C236G9388 n=1 Tax=Albugo laibachii Nc14 TaxID=890382 RepID=F0W8D4_9STRA|nr:conserved hypothetical protein [Albugo laibachii Nc14]CCA24370.1 conserved hypothetical protein [Albugo laibachii Nc14]|eukprot:CCA24370.1 conserved hypothetical protein [Albugo laibachii Nc14]